MKFTDGYWLVREGFKINQLVQIIDYKVFEDKIILYITTKPINHKGDTIDGALITMEISIINESVVKIRYDHHKGIIDDEPKLELNERSEKIKFTEDEKINIDFKDVDISLDKQNWNVRFSYKSKNVTSCDWRSTAYITNDEKSYFREQLSLDIRETIYGLGERFTNFIKNGQEVTIWNEDGSTSTYQSYKNIPFYISSKNYGLFVNSNKKVSFEIGSEVVNRVQFSLEGENLEYYLILADTPKEVLIKYTDLTGKPALPPLWSFGLWLSTSFTTNYDEETVNYFVNKMHELDIPLSVFHYDCFWMKEYEWCNFKFDDKVFPNPKEMLKKLKDKGLKICVWINPYIAQKSQAFEIAKEKGYLIKRKNGSVWQWDKWQSGMGIVDFTNPDACNWFSNCLKSLIDIGVDCFKTDFGERIPIDVVYHNKSNPEAMHNYYSYLYNKVIFKLLRELKSEDAIVFARSGAAGSQKFPVHWGGDCYSSYGSMAESLRGGLSLTSSGFGFWSHDISGFESTATPDVYKRWVQFGLLSTHSRLHGSSSYRVPWEFGEEAVEVLRFFSKLKCKLSPYIFNSAINTSKTGIPSMSSMFINYPEDLNCRSIDTQYMLGENILVAPIFNENGCSEYYLPKGTWTHLISNEVKLGEAWYKEKFDYFSLPIYVKENSIIPIGKVDSTIDYDFNSNIDFNLYFVKDQSYELFDKNNISLGKLYVKRENSEYIIDHNLNFQFKVNIIDETGIRTISK